MLRSRYTVIGTAGPVGHTELNELRYEDGSRSYMVREHLEFWGPVLDRFVVLTFNRQGEIDSGHWVGTSDYSSDFRYSFYYDGRAIRGDWQGSVLGRCWNDVPTRPENPAMGFWGPLESLVVARFNPLGPARQIFEAVDVEDTHHRSMTVTVERLGIEEIEVPAGRFFATKYRSERFGTTHHWIDESGTVIRWASEDDVYSWELESYPSANPLVHQAQKVASGTYKVSSPESGPRGVVTWLLEVDGEGQAYITAEERLDRRISRFAGAVGPDGDWRSCSQECEWTTREGNGPPETQYFETFFHREHVYMLRFRRGAYPLLQCQPAGRSLCYHLVNFPIAAGTWLRKLTSTPGEEQVLPGFVHLANRYRGACLEAPKATAICSHESSDGGHRGILPSHHFLIRYPGGWVNSTFECWTDACLIPLRAKVVAAEGPINYELVDYELNAPQKMPTYLMIGN